MIQLYNIFNIIQICNISRKSRGEQLRGDGGPASAEELDRETGEEQTAVGRTRRKDGGWQTTEESGRVTWAWQEETREAKVCDGRTVLREMRGRQERRTTGRRRQETEEGGKDYQMRRWRSCRQHLTPDKGKKRKREKVLYWNGQLVWTPALALYLCVDRGPGTGDCIQRDLSPTSGYTGISARRRYANFFYLQSVPTRSLSTLVG